ncbi:MULTISPECIES: biotin carboxylase [unclassified Nocardiopsis]|uniref:ATP-grasp domain-containing protein n=1 Tax=unclassified Nocardiopsis TaxID=2649073 RepID=UPI0033C6F386
MKNVFVMGLDQRNRRLLERTPTGRECRFHTLLGIEELQRGEIDVETTLAAARGVLEGFEGTVDAILGFRDFPVTLLVPILCAERGLPAPDLAAVVRCEHKYWSRLIQAGATDALPPFALVDLDAERPRHGLDYPLWIKPIKSASSELAFRAQDDEGFDGAVARLRKGVDRLGRPFESVLSRVDLPAEVARAGRRHCLAEGELHGVQAAAEGCVHRGEVTVYGVLDSVDYPGDASFLCHQYPSGLPERVRGRIVETTERVITAHGLDDATFSVEFFYDPITDGLGVVEVNPRHSQSHAALFEVVDGVANHERMLRLALGRDPHPTESAGDRFPVAAEWYLRRFRDGVVTRVPTPDEVVALRESITGVSVQVVPQEGQRLSDMLAQDSYSYELAKIITGGADELELRAKFERCVRALRFEFRNDAQAADVVRG